MAQIVAPTRNPLIPVPLMPSAALQQRRGMVAPNPGASPAAQAPLPPAAPTAQPAATMAPIAYAQGQYRETGSPWTAAAQGWINASHAREESAAEQAKRDEVAAAVAAYPDLARFAQSGVMDPEDVVRLAGERDKLAADTQASEARKAKILEYLGQTDPDLAEAFAAGAIDEDGIAREIGKRDDGKTSAREEQIARLEETGLSREISIGIVDGRYKDSINPTTGERTIIDMGTNSMVPIAQPEYDAPTEEDVAEAEPQPTGASLWEMAPEATGVGSTLANVSSNTLGQLPGAIGEAMTFEEPVEAQQEFELFKRDLIQSLSLNPRFPVAEMQRIEGLIPRGPTVAPGTLKTAMKALDRELARIESVLEASLDDPRTPVEQRQSDTVTLRGVKGARARMGVPHQDNDAGDDTPAPEDVDPELWQEMTPEERALWN